MGIGLDDHRIIRTYIRLDGIGVVTRQSYCIFPNFWQSKFQVKVSNNISDTVVGTGSAMIQ